MTIKTILIATDFSEDARRLSEAARSLLALNPNRILLIHVLNPPQASIAMASPGGSLALPPEISDAEREAHAAAESQAKAGLAEFLGSLQTSIPVEMEVLTGPAPDSICRKAAECSADLLVLASHGHGALRRALLGSTAQYLANHAPCDVLILRPRPQSTAATPTA